MKIVKALADDVRLRIVNLISKKELCVCEIEEVLEMSEPRISRHLRILREAGIVKCNKDGKWCFYTIVEDAYINGLISQFFSKTENIKVFKEDIKKANNTKAVCKI